MNSSLTLNKEVNSGNYERESVSYNGSEVVVSVNLAAEEKISKREIMPKSSKINAIARFIRDFILYSNRKIEEKRNFLSNPSIQLHGRSYVLPRTYLFDFEAQVLKETQIVKFNRMWINSLYEVQSRDEVRYRAKRGYDIARSETTTNFLENHSELYTRIRAFCAGIEFDKSDFDYFVKLLEDVLLTLYSLIKCDSWLDCAHALTVFVKLRYPEPLLSSDRLKVIQNKFTEIFYDDMEVQGAETVLKDARKMLEKFDEVREAPIFKKLHRLGMFMLAHNLYEKIGITFDTLRYSKVEAYYATKEYSSYADFIACYLDTTLFLCERGYQCMKTGSIEPLLHSESTYDLWYKSVEKIKLDVLVLNNPDPHGVNLHSFLGELDDAIDKGESIYKHAHQIGKAEKNLVGRLVHDLKMIKRDQLSKREANRTRRAPFSLLVFGGSGVAKSKLVELMFYQYAKIFDLPSDSSYMYTRNALDPFWSGFTTSKWCGLLDDIAFMNPNVAVAGDPSMMEMIQIINNIALTPNQAALEDKGRTPVKFKFVMATTNEKDLNAHAYFNSPLAAQRRLPYILDVQPKPEYTSDNVTINPLLIPPTEDGCYPDLWLITISKVVPANNNRKRQKAAFKKLETFDCICDFLQWFNKTAREHEAMQIKGEQCTNIMKEVVLCKDCEVPLRQCVCFNAEVQSRDFLTTDERCGMNYYKDDDGSVIAVPVPKKKFETQTKDTDREFNDNQLEEIEIYKASLEHTARERSYFNTWCSYFYLLSVDVFLTLYFEISIFRWGANWIYSFPVIKIFFARIVGYTVSDSRVVNKILKKCGKRVQSVIGRIPMLYAIVGILTGVGSLFLVGKVLRDIFSYSPEKVDSEVEFSEAVKVEEKIEEIVASIDEVQLQKQYEIHGQGLSVGKPPVDDEIPKVNAWKKMDYVTTTFDTSDMTRSYKAHDFSEVVKILSRNCVYIKVKTGEDNGRRIIRPNGSICVAGHHYLTNNHALPTDGVLEIEVISGPLDTGITGNKVIKVCQRDIIRDVERDIAVFLIRDMPPRKHILRLFCKPSLQGVMEGTYLQRNRSGAIVTNVVRNIRREYAQCKLGTFLGWHAVSNEQTTYGDCGSIMIANTADGPIILGLHTLGVIGTNGVVSTSVDCDNLKGLISSLPYACIQPNPPQLSAPSAKRGLVELHHNSNVRYAVQGCANVYGSFSGFRARMKSHVEPTYLADKLKSKGYTTKCGKPDMGWRPWHLAMKDMVNPVNGLRSDILDACVTAFSADILKGLTTEQLVKIHVYDEFTALNGAARTNYVEHMDWNTSAGCPWKKSKRYFVKSAPPQLDLLEPKVLDSEMRERVDLCELIYSQGKRYMPVFCGNLKDEPKPFDKINAGKTRVFAGAPFEWSVVVRKNLLAFIKCAQENRYLFEMGVGTTAQSTQWGDLFDYLTQHGQDRIVAGDYAAFDKSMCAQVVMAAFTVIRNICEAAGYTEEELRTIDCIAADTAFPLMDFDGDLIEFFGTNPSGHPLTVIINSIVNSLYMRYVFGVLSPSGTTLSQFKELVSLFTYGDDNIMGVSQHAPWFNHTSIQNALADVGIKYTMAEKTMASIPYIHITAATFLKRSWRWDPDVGAYLCPIEHDSIERGLMSCVKPKIHPHAHAVDSINGALREYFFYGKEIYEEKLKLFRPLIDENLAPYVTTNTFPSWDTLKDMFWSHSRVVG